MSILGTGIDLVEIARIEGLLTRTQTGDGDGRFVERVFTQEERRYCQTKARPAESFAARFAAKEAAMKVLGTGWGEGVTFRDIEVVRDGFRPTLVLHGQARERALELGVTTWHVSLSHTNALATAVVVASS